MSVLRFAVPLLAIAAACSPAVACDLCAIYRASDAKGEFSTGWGVTISEQFTAYRTEQFNGIEFDRPNPDYLDKSMTHLVAGWNFHERAGVSMNLPIVHLSYSFADLENGVTPRRLDGSDTGIGDLALVGRWLAFDKREMDWGLSVNLLGGIKFPTGDTERLEQLERSIDAYEAIVGPGHQHDPLGTITSGIHLHDLTLGSGSVDGIFGVAGTARWQRAFLNFQGQYYLRTEGAGDYRMANELIVSGGPGAFLWLDNRGTLTLQLNAVYDTRGSDEFRGQPSAHTGATVMYLGPVIGFTWKSHFSTLLGVDIPLSATARGFQNVPTFRVNATVSWRF